MLRTPKVRMAVVLGILAVVATGRFFSVGLLARLLFIFTVVIIAEYTFWKVRKIDPFLPSAGVVTALIIFLLADPSASFLLIALACLVAVGLKQLVRFGGNHIFNPAAAGLLLASLLGLPISWWGVSWGVVPLVLTLMGAGLVSLWTIHQYRIVVSFVLTIILGTMVLLGNFQPAFGQLSVGSFWFFALVMLPEPMTAARYSKTRVFYGAFVGALSFLAAKLVVIDPLVLSLIVGNASVRILEESGFKN